MSEKNYVAELRDQLAVRLPQLDAELLDLYTLLGLQYGRTVDEVMVHNAWAVWCNRTDPGHRSLIPFPYLAPDVQALDEPYVDAIRAAVDAVYVAQQQEAASRAGGAA